MKVLVALDESAYSQIVVDTIAERPWHIEDQFLVISVVAIPTAEYWQDLGLKVDPESKQKLTARARSLVEACVARLTKELQPKSKIESRIEEGHAGDQILETARQWQADLIVMGSHKRTGLKKLFLGSVAQEVLREAPCSVEIVKTPGCIKTPKTTQTLVQAR